jgi:DNA-binding MarR family transcriptional regulator
VVHFIGRNPGITVAALLTLLRITKQSLARVLREVMDRNLVLQRQGLEDRRQRQLFLTPRGTSLEARLSEVQQENLARAFASVPSAAIAGWRAVLWSMVEPEDRDRLQHAQERRQQHGTAQPKPKRAPRK